MKLKFILKTGLGILLWSFTLRAVVVEGPTSVFAGDEAVFLLRSMHEVRDLNWQVNWNEKVLAVDRLVIREGEPASIRVETPDVKIPVILTIQAGGQTRKLTVVPRNVLEAFKGEWEGGPPQVWDPQGSLRRFLKLNEIEFQEIHGMDDIQGTYIIITGLSATAQGQFSEAAPELLRRRCQILILGGDTVKFPVEPLWAGAPRVELEPATRGGGLAMQQIRGKLWLVSSKDDGAGWSRFRLEKSGGRLELLPLMWPDEGEASASTNLLLFDFFNRPVPQTPESTP